MNTIKPGQYFATFDECRDAIKAFNARWEDKIPGVDPGYDWSHVVLDDYNFDEEFIFQSMARLPEWMEGILKGIRDKHGMNFEAIAHDSMQLAYYVAGQVGLIAMIMNSDTESWFEDDEAVE